MLNFLTSNSSFSDFADVSRARKRKNDIRSLPPHDSTLQFFMFFFLPYLILLNITVDFVLP